MAQSQPVSPASVATANMIAFTLPKPILLMNEFRKLDRIPNGVGYKKYRDALSSEIASLVPSDPYRKPWRYAAVTVRRFSTGTPDVDAVCVKGLLDVLQPRSGRHPSGLGLIFEDGPEFLTLTVECEKVSKRTEHRTLVTIERLSQTDPVIVL